MSMFLTSQYIERVKQTIDDGPFCEGELRRIEGLGGMYIAPSDDSTIKEDENYVYERLMTLSVSEIMYSIFTRFPK